MAEEPEAPKAPESTGHHVGPSPLLNRPQPQQRYPVEMTLGPEREEPPEPPEPPKSPSPQPPSEKTPPAPRQPPAGPFNARAFDPEDYPHVELPQQTSLYTHMRRRTKSTPAIRQRAQDAYKVALNHGNEAFAQAFAGYYLELANRTGINSTPPPEELLPRVLKRGFLRSHARDYHETGSRVLSEGSPTGQQAVQARRSRGMKKWYILHGAAFPFSGSASKETDALMPYLKANDGTVAKLIQARQAHYNARSELDRVRGYMENPGYVRYLVKNAESLSEEEIAAEAARILAKAEAAYRNTRDVPEPIIADALEDAGYTDPDVLDYLRGKLGKPPKKRGYYSHSR